jgi:hypothetical protein
MVEEGVVTTFIRCRGETRNEGKTMTDPTHSTRRTFLTLAGATTLTSLTAGCLGLGGGGEESGKSVDETIYIGGKVAGWQGIYPNDIDGKSNPTLQLTAGTTYKIGWVNLDGKKHELIIENDSGEHLVASEHAKKKGMSRSVTFEATTEMTSYFCEYHPKSMRGKVVVSK